VDSKAVADTSARCGHESGLEGCEDYQCGFGRYECLGIPRCSALGLPWSTSEDHPTAVASGFSNA